MQKRYTKSAQKVLDNAKKNAVALEHGYIGT